jgi:glycosyltransferase involved in cell wall biosynthesis
MHAVILNWQLGTNFGWGLLGLNLFAQWAHDQELQPIMGMPIKQDQLYGVDPLRHSRIWPTAQASNEFLTALGDVDPTRAINAIQIDCIGNDFESATPRRSRRMIGRTIFETSATAPARELLKKYDLLLTASNWNAAMLKQATGRDAAIIHEGVDLSLFCPAPRSGWLDPDRFYIFSGGKVEYRKGQDLVLMAFRRFASRHADAMLVTAWHSPWPQYSVGFRGRLDASINLNTAGMLDVPRWAVENGISARQVLDVGRIANILMPGVLREMHVVLQPSRAEACTSLPVKEAMACGLPVIAARNTGMLDILTDDNCLPLRRQGAVVPINNLGTDGWGESDIEEIDAALESVYQDRDAGAATGVRARQYLIDNGRSWQQHAASLKQWVLANAA